MNENEVYLTTDEVIDAASVGVRRHISSVVATVRPYFDYDVDEWWSTNIEGACGEAVFAKWLGVPWNHSVDAYDQPDFVVNGIPIDVKTRPGVRHTDLIVKEKRPNRWIFVLVLGVAPEYRIAGWVTAEQARARGSVKDPDGRKASTFVTIDKLNPWSTLREALGCEVKA